MRAGLLSRPEVIKRLSERFICTMAIIDDVKKAAAGGDELAKELAANWHYPVEMIFLSPDGKLVSKLNSFEDFPGVHPEVAAPAQKAPELADVDQLHVDVLLKNITEHFGKE